MYQYQIMDYLDSVLRQHQGPLSDLPEAQQTQMLCRSCMPTMQHTSSFTSRKVAYMQLQFLFGSYLSLVPSDLQIELESRCLAWHLTWQACCVPANAFQASSIESA